MMKNRILFVQLPLHGHGHEYIQGNVPYAGAVMSAYCNRFLNGLVVTLGLPSVIADFGSDELITRYISRMSPDMVFFTCYLWNVERNISIARKLLRHLPGVRIFMGGPEVSTGSWVLEEERPGIDLFVSGEGEWFLDLLLSEKPYQAYMSHVNGNRLLRQPAAELIPAHRICEPFMENYLQAGPDRSIFMELTRGCPYRCSYCYYSRNAPGVRELPFSCLTDAIRRGRDTLREIYILSPTFDRSAGFRENLRELASLEHGIRLHTEMRAGGIDADLAGLLYDAGFRSLEVGLQTMNPSALQEVGRRGDPGRDIRGMKHLRDAGIDLKIGIIPGLPGDGPADFMKTVELLIDEGLGDFMELYPLMILPGTGIRERALSGGISFQAKPPYYYTGGWGMDLEDIHEIGFRITQETGFRPGVFSLPDLRIEGDGLFCRGVQLPCDGDFTSGLDEIISSIDTHVFTFFYRGEGPLHRQSIAALAEGAGDGLFHHVFFRNEAVDEDFLAGIVSREGDSLHARMAIFQGQLEGWRHRFTQVFSVGDAFFRMKNEYSLVEPVLIVGPGDSRIIRGLDPETDSLLVGREGYRALRKDLLRVYGDYPERLAFENEENEEDFYSSLGLDWVSYPYSFYVRDLTGRRK